MASTLDFKRRSQVELQSKEEPVIGNHLEETFEQIKVKVRTWRSAGHLRKGNEFQVIEKECI